MNCANILAVTEEAEDILDTKEEQWKVVAGGGAGRGLWVIDYRLTPADIIGVPSQGGQGGHPPAGQTINII